MSLKRRIVLISDESATAAWLWGAGHAARMLAAAGQEVHLVAVRRWPEFLLTEYAACGIDCASCPVRGWWDWQGLRRLARLLQGLDAELWHLWGLRAAVAGVALRRALPAARRTAVVASAVGELRPGLVGWFTRLHLQRLHRLLVTTRAEGERYHRWGIPTDILRRLPPLMVGRPPVRRGPVPSTSPTTSGWPVARWIVLLNADDNPVASRWAIIACDILRYNRADVRLLIVTDTTTAAQRAIAFARRLQWDDLRLVACPWWELQDWPADVVAAVVPAGVWSVHQALTAIHAGWPVLAVATPDVQEILEDGTTALLVADAVPSALASALRRVLDEPLIARRLVTAAHKWADEKWTPPQALEQLDTIYDEVCREATERPNPIAAKTPSSSVPD